MTATDLHPRFHRRVATLMSLVAGAQHPYKRGVRIIAEAQEFFEPGSPELITQTSFSTLNQVCINNRIILLVFQSFSAMAQARLDPEKLKNLEPGIHRFVPSKLSEDTGSLGKGFDDIIETIQKAIRKQR